MLLNKLRETENIISEVRELKEIDSDLKNCKILYDMLKSKKKNINNYTISQITLIKNNSSYFELPELSKVNNSLDDIIKKVDSGIFSDSGSLNFITETIKAKEEGLKAKWREYLKEVKKVDDNIKTLECLRNLYSDKNEINNVIVSLNRFNTKWPVNKLVLDELRDNMKLSKEKITDLKLNQNIENFLKMVMKGTATISDLNDEILQWIKDNKFEEVIKLKFS